TGMRRGLVDVPQGAELALVGEHRVEASQFLHRELATPQDEGQTVVTLRRELRDAGAPEELVEIRLRKPGRDGHRRDVAAAHERVLHADRPHEATIEVLGAEGAEGRRHVPEDRQWMHQALIEAERVHERLQGRAGRTLREDSVDLAVDLVVEVAGRSAKPLDLYRLLG